MKTIRSAPLKKDVRIFKKKAKIVLVAVEKMHAHMRGIDHEKTRELYGLYINAEYSKDVAMLEVLAEPLLLYRVDTGVPKEVAITYGPVLIRLAEAARIAYESVASEFGLQIWNVQTPNLNELKNLIPLRQT